MKTSTVYYQQGGGDEQYTPRYGVEVLFDLKAISPKKAKE